MSNGAKPTAAKFLFASSPMSSSTAYRIRAYHFKRDLSGKTIYLCYTIERKQPFYKRSTGTAFVWSISDSFIKRERLHLYFGANRYLSVTVKFSYSKTCNVSDTHIQFESNNFVARTLGTNKHLTTTILPKGAKFNEFQLITETTSSFVRSDSQFSEQKNISIYFIRSERASRYGSSFIPIHRRQHYSIHSHNGPSISISSYSTIDTSAADGQRQTTSKHRVGARNRI